MINRDIYIMQHRMVEDIDYVQYTNEVALVFALRDYTIPQGAVATVYAKKPSGKEVFLNAKISGNTVTVQPTTQLMAEVGWLPIQIIMIHGDKVAATFIVCVNVHPNLSSESAVESTDEFAVLTELVAKATEAITATENATQGAVEAAKEAGEEAVRAETIASDLEKKREDGYFNATIAVGQVVTGAPGTEVVVQNSGTPNNAVLDFTIPKGETGSVENIADQVIEFTEASDRVNVKTGDKIATVFGKLAKWYTDLKEVAFSGDYNDLVNTPGDTGWQSMATTSDFTAYSDTAGEPQYRKIGAQVYVQGVVKPTKTIASSATGVEICTLPEGCRPSSSLAFVCHGSARNIWLCQVSSEGKILISRHGTTEAYVDLTTSSWLPFMFSFAV